MNEMLSYREGKCNNSKYNLDFDYITSPEQYHKIESRLFLPALTIHRNNGKPGKFYFGLSRLLISIDTDDNIYLRFFECIISSAASFNSVQVGLVHPP